ncbi:5'/3'-nucleotidase SurE [uncultured Abyssibacter sp.]|uniref:5'/3'-nucleotidase SurE n=1 Tax=uncultured Abyssibacter sp. TaxID=2320202 RepID=UPI0032B1DC62
MHILVSNDDGCQAPGLICLARRLRQFANVTVVAPDRNRSGASNSLTLMRPLRVHQHADGTRCVDGTPTDCVHLALTGLLDEPPDMVVSGINAGANLGDDVLYSGTVAAAMEGRFLGFPSIAVSCTAVEPKHYEAAAEVVVRLIDTLREVPFADSTILNVNVPDRPFDALEGVVNTRLGNRHKAEPVIQDRDPKGREIFWIGPTGPELDAGPGTDFDAISRGYASVTPIQVDLTRHEAIEPLGRWLPRLRD